MAGESKLQKKCTGYAEGLGILVRKVRVEGRRGWPDLCLIFPSSGQAIWVEMKNPNKNGRLMALQKREHDRIRKRKALVYRCDSFEDFKEIVEIHLIN